MCLVESRVGLKKGRLLMWLRWRWLRRMLIFLGVFWLRFMFSVERLVFVLRMKRCLLYWILM